MNCTNEHNTICLLLQRYLFLKKTLDLSSVIQYTLIVLIDVVHLMLIIHCSTVEKKCVFKLIERSSV